MKSNNKVNKCLALVLAASVVSPTMVSASPIVTKEETVYAILDNEGKVNEKISSIWIHSDSALDKVEDTSSLDDIVNIKSDIEPSREADKLIWDVNESDIYYQGTPAKDLPIETNIKYFLDNEEVNPEDILGKDGKFRLEIEVINKDKREELYAPYIVATVVDLPTDKFFNIDTNTGKLISDGSRQIVSHIALPGLKESLNLEKDLKSIKDKLEITADVVDFEMESIMFAVTSEFPEIDAIDSAKDLDDLMDGLDKIEEASDKLIEATEKLADGQKELDKGIDKFIEGANKLSLGSNDLLNGSNKLKDGISSAHAGSKQINQGANTLANSAGQLGQGFSDLGDGTVEFSNKAAEFSKATNQVSEGLSSIPESTKALQAGMEELIASTDTIKNGQENLTNGLNKSTEALQQIKAGKEKESKVIGLLLKGTSGLDAIADGLEKIPGADGLAGKMKEALGEQRAALEGIQNSSNELVAALDQVEVGLREAKEASGQLSQGTKSLNEGQKKINGGLGELANGTASLKDASDQLSQGSAGLQDGANKINNNAKAAKSGANQFSAGSKGLADATRDLSSGLGELNKGSSELNKGIAQLGEGTKELASGGKELKDGSKQLVDGSQELNEGMSKFSDEGLSKITEELEGSDLNIEDLIDRKDELVRLSKENHSFSGKAEDMEGKLKFIMKTESIKKEEAEVEVEKGIIEEEIEVEEIETAKESKGLIGRIKDIFG